MRKYSENIIINNFSNYYASETEHDNISESCFRQKFLDQIISQPFIKVLYFILCALCIITRILIFLRKSSITTHTFEFFYRILFILTYKKRSTRMHENTRKSDSVNMPSQTTPAYVEKCAFTRASASKRDLLAHFQLHFPEAKEARAHSPQLIIN